MEDYKKKYEQALDNFKKIKAANKDNSELVDFIEYEYPELKESENERIRKSIIEEFKVKAIGGYEDKFFRNGVRIKDAIAWLEKQAEHANFRNKIQIGDGVTRNEDGALVNLSQFKRMVKQGKQKSTWSEWDEMSMDTLIHIINNQKGSAIFEGLLPEELVNWLKSLKERMKGE